MSNLIDDPNIFVKEKAIKKAASLGLKAEVVVPCIIKVLSSSKDEWIISQSIIALDKIGSQRHIAIPVVIDKMDISNRAKIVAIDYLKNCKTEAQPFALPLLDKYYLEKDGVIKSQLFSCINAIFNENVSMITKQDDCFQIHLKNSTVLSMPAIKPNNSLEENAGH